MREKLVRRFLILTAAVTVTATLFAACGDDGGGDTSSDDTTTDAPVVDDDTGDNTGTQGEEGTATVLVEADRDELVDSGGYTLYIFEQDDGTTSNCNDACLDIWPALTAEAEPTAGEGVDGALLSTAEQADGRVQVTYNGHLLYTYSGDAAPGETNGTSIPMWLTINAAGEPNS
jgi:predicted lipoprotein with Yx(FWY)xxD motif